ncbi:MAG: class I SAM-dependent DNA methyltransferase [Candidatus Thorarchaeota archaeon]
MSQDKTPLKNDLKQLTKIFRKIIVKLFLEIPPKLNIPNLFINTFESTILSKKDENEFGKISFAYLLTTQIIFYQILSEKRIGLPKIQVECLNHELLSNFFTKAQKITGNPIFKPNVVKIIDNYTYKKLEDSIKEIINLKPEILQFEVLTLIFNILIPSSLRKQIGAYYSEYKTAKLLSHFAIKNPSVSILDPACGSGALLIASYQRKKELMELEKGVFTDTDHYRFISQDITGIDIMPFAIRLSATHLALQAPTYKFQKNRLTLEDSLILKPKSKIEQCFYIRDNSPKEISRLIELDFVDLVIMNPPFVRQESLRKIKDSYKDELFDRFKEHSSLINKKISYYCYFLFLADKFLRSGGTLATIIPASFLRVDTTFKIRDWLLKRYNIQYIFCQRDKPNFSEDTAFREVILIATKNGPTTELEYIIIKDLDKTESFEQLPDSWEKRKIPYEDLSSNNLFLPIATLGKSNLIKIFQLITGQKELISFDILLRSTNSYIKRGIETIEGIQIQDMVINAFSSNYLRSTDNWIFSNETATYVNCINRNSKFQISIPKNCLIPHLRRISGENRLDISKKKEYVVISPFSQFTKMNLNNEKQNNTFERFHRWKTYVKERKTNLMVARRFDICAPGTSLFSFYSKDKRAPPGVMWSIIGLNDDDAKILCLFFNSIHNLLQIFINRVETRGTWMQLHEYVIKDLKVPNITNWTWEKKILLVQLFDEINEKEFPPLWQQLAMNVSLSDIPQENYTLLKSQFPNFDKIVERQFIPRRKLDTLFLNDLGINDRNESLMQEIYLNFLLEIAILKKMMK